MSVWRAYKKHSATSHSARVASHFTSYYCNDLLPSINDARTVAKYKMRSCHVCSGGIWEGQPCYGDPYQACPGQRQSVEKMEGLNKH